MRKHRPKAAKSRAKSCTAKRAPARPEHLQLRDEDTASLDSASGDYDGGATSKDKLLRKGDTANDPGYDVYEADSERDDDDDDDECTEGRINDDDDLDGNDGEEEDEDEGYLFVDHCKPKNRRRDPVLDIECTDDSEEDEEEDEDLRIRMRMHRESGKLYSMISDKDHDLAKINGCTDQVMLRYILDKKIKPLAPPLNDNLQFHVFFLCHHNDHDWTLSVIDKLQAPPLGFHCFYHERDVDLNGSLHSSTHLGMKNSQKTVMVLTPDFIADVWCHADLQLLSEMDVLLIQKDLILLLLQECDIPSVLTSIVCVDVAADDWWGKLLALLITSEDTPVTEETALSLSSSLMGLNPNLQSGNLLHSAKSRCVCCGKEVVDPGEIPDELIAHGVQIPPDEYKEAIQHLMKDNKFKCHVWCYNVPAAILFFTVLLALCLAIIPFIEAKLIFDGSETGLEFVHAGVVWLCVLTLYMAVMQISKRRMKGNTYKRLAFVNTILIKYNLLAGVENLGLADCNKYYLHFFYFEMGPCLAYLQELMLNIEEYSTCFRNQTAETGDVTIDMACDDSVTGDASRVLNNTAMTNTSMQTQAEDLILQHSGEYISMLITKRLCHPRRQRHVRDYPCLCQFVEQRVYKMVV